MIKLALVSLLVACNGASASAPIPEPRNLAAEDVAIIDKTLECKPQFTDSGERHTHSCVIASKQVVCVTNDVAVGLVCGPLQLQPQTAEPKK